jgi:hypothetical protein
MTQAAALLDYSIIGVIRGRWKPGFRFQKRKPSYTCPAKFIVDGSPTSHICLVDSTLGVILGGTAYSLNREGKERLVTCSAACANGHARDDKNHRPHCGHG